MKNIITGIKLVFKGYKEVHRIKPWLITMKSFRSLFEAVMPFINIYMSAIIIDGILNKIAISTLIKYAIITVLVNLFVVLMSQLLAKYDKIMSIEFSHRMEKIFAQKTIDMDYETIEDPKTHKTRELIKQHWLLNGGGLQKLVQSSNTLMSNIFKAIFAIHLTTSLFFIYNTNDKLEGFLHIANLPVTSIVLGMLILANVIINLYTDTTKTKGIYRIMSDTISVNRIANYYYENYIAPYQSGKEIRIYNQKKIIQKDFEGITVKISKIFNKLARNQTKYTMIMTISSRSISALIYLFVGLKALAGSFGVGSIVKYIGSTNLFVLSLSMLIQECGLIFANNEALKIYFDYIELPNKLYQGTLPVEKRFKCDYGDNDYKIEFDNVSFKYPGTQEYALKNVSLKLRVGQRMAVVGMNGSGKTTFIKLLCRLYDPTEGVIKLNGIDIKKYDYDDYLSIFSVVFQDFKLFSFELGQNVGNTINYDEERAKRYLTKAGFGERYNKLDKGLKTCLYKDFEEDGVEISGGEAQKIALARALYKDAPFIVLDEPTAALDPIAEFEIYSRFNEIVEDKTAIYISHRLSSCRFCDDIVVFHEGRLIQRGDHDHLLTQSEGKYNELWNAQAQYYNEKQSV